MSRLDQILEPLFSQPGVTLVLESNTTGVYVREGAAELPVFRQLLRTGQILLLFAEVVPKDQSQALLTGQPIDFRHESKHGALDVHMDMRGSEIKIEVKLPPSAGRAPLATVGSPPSSVTDQGTASLKELISQLSDRRASHLHLVAGAPAFLRVDGHLVPVLEHGAYTPTHIREALASVAPSQLQELVLTHPRFDFTYVTRASVFHVRAQESRGGLSVVVRALPREVPTVSSLGVPGGLVNGLVGQGLWVLAGAAGQGTSTTLAALAQGVLDARPAVVCAIEAPIEYVLSPARGLVQQLEVGAHVESFAEALVQARSTDTDLIVVGELDDPETLAEAIALADRGRLVLGALHATRSVDAISKMLTMLSEQRALQLRLAAVLRGVFAQQLVPNVTGGRTIAWEVLEASDEVRAVLRDGALSELGKLRQHRLEESLLDLVLKGEVEAEVALALACDRTWLEERFAQAAHTRAA